MRATGIAAASLLLGPLLGCGRSPSGEPPPDLPHVVLISIDTLNPAGLRAYSSEAAALPNLDAFADESARYRHAFATASWTLPSHASMMTGLYPDRHGATDPRRRIAEDARMLAEVLRDAGYETVGLTDGGYVDAEFGFGRGFRLYNGDSSGRGVRSEDLPRRGRPNRNRGATLFDRAIAFLKARDPGDGPLFLFLQTYAVHDYFKVHSWAAGRDAGDREALAKRYRGCVQGSGECSEEDWADLVRLYRAEVAHLDEGFGRLLTALEEAGIGRGATIAVVSDHGEGFDPGRNRIHHGGRLNADLIRIPFLLRSPWIPAGDVETPFSLVDLMPTLLEAVGRETPAGLDGRPLGPSAPPADPAPVYAMEHYYRWEHGRRSAVPETRAEPLATAVIDGDRWLIAGEAGAELYDMRTDPEQRTAAGRDAPEADELLALILRRLRSLPEAADATLGADLQEQLESLGYVE